MRLDNPAQVKTGGPLRELPLNDFSDGDPSKRGDRKYSTISNDPYRIKTAKLWAEKRDLPDGSTYYLERLPFGYQLMDIAKPADASIRYKRLFGHPSGRFFDSQLRFFPHFIWLMNGMSGKCECVLCNKKRDKPIPAVAMHKSSSSRPAASNPPTNSAKADPSKKSDGQVIPRKGRPTKEMMAKRLEEESRSFKLSRRSKTVSNYYDSGLYSEKGLRPAIPEGTQSNDPTDAEGTPHVWKEYVQRLFRYRESRKVIDDNILQLASPDWRALRNDKHGKVLDVLKKQFIRTELQHSFVPRLGELVLWCRDHPDKLNIVYNPAARGFQFYDPKRGKFHGFPQWLGGVVTETPISDETIDFPDILGVINRPESLNQAGFCVELFPNPNDDKDKSASKQRKYVRMRQIRPLNHWQQILAGIPDHAREPSVFDALTCMTSLSLVDAYRFAGKWPDASILAKGIYLGAEFLIEGDTVRVLDVEGGCFSGRCNQVLVIESIRLVLTEMSKEHASSFNSLLSSKVSVSFVGKGYTTDRNHHLLKGTEPELLGAESIRRIFSLVATGAYGNWYLLHGPQQRMEVSSDMVAGRLYESGAMSLWNTTPANNATPPVPPTLDWDVAGILFGRRYATQADERIPELPDGAIHWLWSDTRVMGLSLETVNGWQVGPYTGVRDPQTLRSWRAHLKFIDGKATEQDRKDALFDGRRGRKKGSRLVNGRIVGPGDESENEMEVELAQKGSFSEAVRSRKKLNSMVNAGAVIGGEDDDTEDSLGDDTDANSFPKIPSKLEIAVPHDSDDEMTSPSLPERTPTIYHFADSKQSIKARKSMGVVKAKPLPTYAGHFDHSIPTALREASPEPQSKSKGKQRADTPPNAFFKPDQPMTFVKTTTQQDAPEQPKRSPSTDPYAPENFVEPEPEDDGDYDDDMDDVEGDEDDDEDSTGSVSDDEEQRLKSLASFQKTTFTKAGGKLI